MHRAQHKPERESEAKELSELKKTIRELKSENTGLKRQVTRLRKQLTQALEQQGSAQAAEEEVQTEPVAQNQLELFEEHKPTCALCGSTDLATINTPTITIIGCKKCKARVLTQ